MLIYNGNRIKYQPGTLVVMHSEQIEQWHFIATNQNRNNTMGKKAVSISCLAIAESPSDYNVLRQIIHNFGWHDIIVFDELYKNASIVNEKRFIPATPDGSVKEIYLTFSAADPTPYDPETGEALI